MTYIDPALIENAIHLLLEYLFIFVEVMIDAETEFRVFLDQFVVLGVTVSWGKHLLSS